jgi:hypothetical protein
MSFLAEIRPESQIPVAISPFHAASSSNAIDAGAEKTNLCGALLLARRADW